MKKACYSVCVVIILVVFCDCRRISGGGSRRTGSRPSYPSYRPSPSYHPSPSYRPSPSPSYHPSPSPSGPSYPSYSHPSPPAHPSPSQSHSPSAPPQSHNPSAPPQSHNPSAPTADNKNYGWKHTNEPVGPPVNSKPQQNAVPSSNNHGGISPSAPIQTAHNPSQPIGPPNKATNLGNSAQNPPPYGMHPPAYNPGQPYPPAYTPGGAPPAYSPPQPSYTGGTFHPPQYGGNHPYPQQGYNPQSNYHPQAGYHPQSGYPQTGYHPQGGGVTVINNNINNHHGGYYSPPSYPSYSYHTSDTGSGTLGFFLGYSLAKISTPTFSSYNSYNYDGYRPRYDHYEVHHYYHNNNAGVIEKEKVIESNTIVGCVGDSGSICPANTTSLCTNNGAIMCVASALTTVPCKNEKDTNCIKSSVPCVDKSTPECKGNTQNTTTVNIPCISTAKIYGSLTYVNNTIIVQNVTAANSTTNTTMNTTSDFTTTTVPTTTTTISSVKQEPQNFCVTILALPATRKPTKGEEVFDKVENVFERFLEKAFGIA